MTQTIWCYPCLSRQMCPEAHCDPTGGSPAREHDPALVDWSLVRPAVTIYHGWGLCLEHFAEYLDEH